MTRRQASRSPTRSIRAENCLWRLASYRLRNSSTRYTRLVTTGRFRSGDLNDAPAGIAITDQIDSRRELPLATGVIPVAEFLNALHKIGYDGPLPIWRSE